MPPLPEARRPTRGRVWGESCTVAAFVLGYLWLWRLYGFDLVDEGTQLFQISRVAAGDRPYTDFETGYTPGYFAIQSFLLENFGFVGVRTFGVLLQAAVAATVYALLRDFGGPHTAVAGVSVLVAFLLPVSLRGGAPSNIPYPGWLALPALLVAGGWLARFSERTSPRRERLRVLLIGLACGWAFAVKPNTGLFALGGAALGLASTWRPNHIPERWLGRLLRALAVVATAGLLVSEIGTRLGIALLLPALLAATVAGPPRHGGRRTAVADLVLLAAGFLLMTLPWVVPLAVRIGVEGVGERVFFLGAGAREVVEAYRAPAPDLRPGMLALGSGVLVAMTLAWTRAARLAPWVLLGGVAVGAGFALAGGLRPFAENVMFWACPVALVVGLLTVGPRASAQRERLLLIFASLIFLTMYPRPDLIHLAQVGAIVLLAGLATWSRSARAWRRERRTDGKSRLQAPRVLAAVFLLLAAGRMAPTLLPRMMDPVVTLGLGPQVSVQVLERHAEHYRTLGSVVGQVREHTEADDVLFTFPDLAGLAFLAERRSPFYYLYFVPGRPNRMDARLVEGEWREFAPRLALIGHPQVPAFAEATEYFADLLSYIRARTDAEEEVFGIEFRVRPGT